MPRTPDKPAYVFPGMAPFVNKAGEDLGLDLHQLGRSQQVWHLSQLQTLLGQLPGLDPESQQKMLAEHIQPVLESLEGTLEAAKAAVDDAVKGLSIKAAKKPDKKK